MSNRTVTPSLREQERDGETPRRRAIGVAGAGTWAVSALTSAMCTLRLRCAWLRALRSVAGVGLKLFPSIYDGQDRHKREHASGTVRDRRRTEELYGRLQSAETDRRASADEIIAELGIDLDRPSLLTAEYARHAFADALARGPDAIVQYSGGADSTAAAVLATLAFERVHLLTFQHPFIRASEHSRANARKLVQLFGETAVIHREIDVTDALDGLLFSEYFSDLRRFGTAPIGWPCLACKMSFDIGTLRYAAEQRIGVVADGADFRVSYQLSQGDPLTMAVRDEWYASHGVSFTHPVARIEDTVTELLLFGLQTGDRILLYPKQGHCVGNDMLGTAYKRFYYIPRFGMDALRAQAIEWMRAKIDRLDPTVVNEARPSCGDETAGESEASQ
ncbi:MAG: hypothetical protein ACOX9R_04800 [Armatimonadota bacterium]|jgi:hypothetical protein